MYEAIIHHFQKGICLLILGLAPGANAQNLPVHEGTRVLRSGDLVIEVGDPASEACRWNQGLRFSPVANVLRLQLRGQEFLYSPLGGGQVGWLGGLPMEFDIGQEDFQPDPPGYNEGNSGDPFLKIGVGILTRNGSAYNFSSSYPIVELAETTATWGTDRVRFVQTLTGTANGYAYRLEEDLVVKNDRLIMRYVLENTGTREFTTEQYLHNFLAFSNRSVGPDYRVHFPYAFTASPEVPLWSPPTSRLRTMAGNPDVVRQGNIVAYLARITSVPKFWIYKPEGYVGRDVFAVEQTGTGQRLTIDTSAPTPYVGIWTTDYQVSPEQFVLLTLAPGQTTAFTRTYAASVDAALTADSTGDGLVNAVDMSNISSAWLSAPGAVNWEPACDVAKPMEDRIDLADLAVLSGQWRRDARNPVPAAHWALDETAGLVAGDRLGRTPGTLHGFTGEGSHWVEGKIGGGLLLDGTDDAVDVTDVPALCRGTTRTVTAWVKTSERSAAPMTILAWQAPGRGLPFSFGLGSGGRLQVTCSGGSAVAQALVGDTRWHHVAAVLDPLESDKPRVSDVRLYVDGQRQNLYDLAEGEISIGCGEEVRIGGSFEPENPHGFGGVLDEMRIFDIALGAADIARIYAETTS
jgi:Concanavalin A-like lectin/glucanases superfamily